MKKGECDSVKRKSFYERRKTKVNGFHGYIAKLHAETIILNLGMFIMCEL